MSLLFPKPAEQLVPLHGFAMDTILFGKYGNLRSKAREGEATAPDDTYVDPHKKPGALTEKQKESIEDRVRVKEMVKKAAEISFSESMPPPPSGKEVYGQNKNATRIARNIYEDNPVKTVPYASTVKKAYEQHKTDQGPFIPYIRPTVSLPPLYKLYA